MNLSLFTGHQGIAGAGVSGIASRLADHVMALLRADYILLFLLIVLLLFIISRLRIAQHLRREKEGLRQALQDSKSSQQALRESGDRFELVLSGSELGAWDRDIVTGRLVIDDRWAEMLGYRVDELAPHIDTWKSMIHPEDQAGVQASLDAHLEGKTPVFESEFRMRTKEGDWKWVFSRGKVNRRDAEGRPLRISGSHLDLSSRKAVEEQLRQSEARYRLLFERMQSGFALHELLYDADGNATDYRFLEVNPAFEAMTGLKKDAVLGRCVKDVMPTVNSEWLERYGRVVKTGHPERFERYSEELKRYFDVVAYSPSPGTFATIINDVTHRRRDEMERIKMERQVQQAQRLESLGLLAGGIAHDFNNLLMGILGNASLLREGEPLSGAAVSGIKEIESAAKRAAELCRQLLAYAGKGRLIIEPLDLNATVREISDLLHVSISKKAIVRYHFSDGIPVIEGDASQVRQVVMNLMTNASEAIDDRSGVITVSTGAVECDALYLQHLMFSDAAQPGVYAYIEVEDTGCGMDQATRERIFDPFFSTKFTGRGLGLAAVMGIIRGHGGCLELDTRPNRGSRFRVLFPVVASEVVGAASNTGERAQLHGGGRVLLVDDDETVRVVGQSMLQKAGFDVDTAVDGRQAMQVFANHPGRYQCVILDLTMPHMDGRETLERIRETAPEQVVFISSGYAVEDIADRFDGLRFDGVIEKPYDYETLISRLASVLG